MEQTEIELDKILVSVGAGAIDIEEGRNKILNLLGISKDSVLCGGDDLSMYGDYIDDYRLKECEKIKSVLIAKGFVNAGLRDALGLWSAYSDFMAAGWLGMPDEDEEIYNCIKEYICVTHCVG